MHDNQAHQDFISTVSHELRTPMTSIRGFAQTMLSSWDKLDDESKKKFLQIIEQQSNRLIHLVENMLSVSKLQTDENYIYKSVSVQRVVENVLQIIKPQYKNHKFVLKCKPNLPDVLADSDKLQQIMLNLIENAAKYSNENTTIKVTTGYSDDAEFVSIKVIDEGIGIKKEDSEKIFTKFARLDNPLTRKVQGSGLGLYITKMLIEKMGGKITFTSEGKGTVFEALMPINDIEQQARVRCLPKP